MTLQNPIPAVPRLTIPLLGAIYLVAVFLRSSPSVLAMELAESFQVGLAEVSVISGATMLAYGLVQIPAGLLADKFGGRRTTFLLTLLMACGSLLFAISPTLSSAAGVRFVTGLGSACLVPSLVLLARLFPPERFASANAFVLFIGHMGMLVASSPLAFLDSLVGWRSIMAVCGILTLTLAVMFRLTIPESSNHLCETRHTGTGQVLCQAFRKLVKIPRLLPLMLTYCLHIAVFYSLVSFWWTPFLVEGHGFTRQLSGNIMFAGVVGLILSFPLMPPLMKKLRSHKRALILIIILALLALLPMCLPDCSSTILYSAGMLFIITGSMATIVFTSLKNLVPADCLGLASGCLSTLPFILSPILQRTFGAILEWRLVHRTPSEAFAEAMYVHVIGIIFAFIFSTYTKETYK